MKRIKFIVLGLILMFSLSACQIPFTEKQVTMPFLEKNPKNVLNLMQENLFNVENFRTESNLEILFSMLKPEDGSTNEIDYYSPLGFIPKEVKMILNSSGVYNRFEDYKYNIEADTNAVLDLGNMTYSGKFSQINFSGDNYLKIREVPSAIEMFISSMLNKWIKLEDVANTDSDLYRQFGIGSLGLATFGDDKEDSAEENDEAEQMIKKVGEILSETNIYIPIKRFPDEKVDEHNCYKYQVTINPELIRKIKTFVLEELRGEKEKMALKQEAEELIEQIGLSRRYDEEDMDKLEKNISNIFDNYEKIFSKNNIEVWVDKKDFYLRKITIDLEIDLIEVSRLLANKENASNILEELEEYESIKISINLDNRYFDHNQAPDIKAPEDARDLNELMEDSPLIQTPRIKSRDARRISDIKQVQTVLELYYNDESVYPETVQFDGESSITATSAEITYMTIVPKNPLPNDGECLNDFNYEYSVKEDRKSYELKYCIGLDTGVVPSGINIASPSGITNYDVYLDEFEAIDAERIADIKQVQTALELYYNDVLSYPEIVSFDGKSSISNLNKEQVYMAIVPQNPISTNHGVCPVNFNYEYRIKDNGASYELAYCLGSDYKKGYLEIPAGINIATFEGISDREANVYNIGEIGTDETEMDNYDIKDSDGDGLDDLAESIFGTDPQNPDSDGDGYMDGSEVENGYNPSGDGTLDQFYEEQMGTSSEIIAL